MSYYSSQITKNIKLRDKLTGDPGMGMFFGKPREFVLLCNELNLMEEIREKAIKYFNDNVIPFWGAGVKKLNKINKPSGHMLSSQISCINNLMFIRDRHDIATAMLKNIDSKVKCALCLDNDKEPGFVSFEVIGREKHYLNEKNHSRGANATSIDAVMLAEMENKSRKIFFIEWKYVEEYKGDQSKFIGNAGITRKNIYLPLLKKEDCPIIVNDLSDTFIEGLFYEPFYQLLRQTLLAHEMIKGNDFGATDYVHIHVIPSGNIELKLENTSKGILNGRTLEDAWKGLLKIPEKYKVIDPKDLLEPIRIFSDVSRIINYLQLRYWD